MSLSPGARIGPYEILAPLGAGGMGEVYRATDTTLHRDVALKVPEAFARDADRMARFAREAQTLAALNHPNIAAIYGVEQNALVMELVEGETLAGPLPVETALRYTRQIADALEAAHEKNIVHRDLKPANLKVTPEGVVKVLDFGLARAVEEPAPSHDPANSPTLTMRATQSGMILGAAAYMAPEQARGQTVDKRADVWAFGAMLYEILTGKAVFDGESVTDILASVVKSEPDWSALPPDTPPAIQRLIRACLVKDRKRRLQAIGDARLFFEEPSAVVETAQTGPRRAAPWIAAAAVFAVAALTLALIHFRESPPETLVLKYSILPPEKTTFFSPAVSPNGRLLAFTAMDSPGRTQIWLRPLDSLVSQPLAGTDGALNPFWSPDSRFVGFFAGGKLKKIEASGRPAQTICTANGRSGAWSRDGWIVFAANDALFRVPASGGEPTAITSIDASRRESFHRWPFFLPDGRHLLYTVLSSQPNSSGIYLGALDSPERTRLLGDVSNVAYSGGYLLFARSGMLMAQRFDAGKLRLEGEPLPVAEHIVFNDVAGYASYSVSENGVLIYDSSSFIAESQLTWFDRSGKRLATVGEPGIQLRVHISPDEKRVAVDRWDPQTRSPDLWLIDLARGVFSRFTFAPKRDWCPVWSPDGARIAFSSNRDGAHDLYEKSSSGGGKEELLLKSDLDKYPTDWSPDGRFLLYNQLGPQTSYDLWLLPLSGGKKPAPFLQTEFTEQDESFAPDGKWLAYTSNESGKDEIYVQTFPASTGQWQISKGGGSKAKWRRDGKELLYLAGDSKTIMAVEVSAGAAFHVGVPQPLFETGAIHRFAVSANGQRFLVPTATEANSSALSVVINWMAGIKR